MTPAGIEPATFRFVAQHNLLRKKGNYRSEIRKGYKKHKTRNTCEFRYSLFRDTG